MLGVLRLLKEKTTARLSVVDTTLTGDEVDVYFKPMLKRWRGICQRQQSAGSVV
jgi:hypothetical protein